MRKVVCRLSDIPVGNEKQILRAFTDIEKALNGRAERYDGIFISVNSGIAYLYVDVEQIKVKGATT